MTATGGIETRSVTFPNGHAVPPLGQGTWMMAQGRQQATEEEAALRLGIDLGLTLIDTAEMYGDGAAEELVGRAIAGRRNDVFLVSKVLPSHATRRGAIAACEASLRRLRVDRLDLYLLHWPGSVKLTETIGAFETLREQGKITAWGISNFDTPGLREVHGINQTVQTNQILYNLGRRGPEFDLLPWCHENQIPVMAYSPLEQGRIFGHPALTTVARRHGATEAQIALAWLIAQPGIIAIPKSGDRQHVRDNAGALAITLTPEDVAELDRGFPPPRRRQPLEML